MPESGEVRSQLASLYHRPPHDSDDDHTDNFITNKLHVWMNLLYFVNLTKI